jgi:hypothetical protein
MNKKMKLFDIQSETNLSEILTLAKPIFIINPKNEDKKPCRFTFRTYLFHYKSSFGKICLTVDVLRRKGKKDVNYLTAIEKKKGL